MGSTQKITPHLLAHQATLIDSRLCRAGRIPGDAIVEQAVHVGFVGELPWECQL